MIDGTLFMRQLSAFCNTRSIEQRFVSTDGHILLSSDRIQIHLSRDMSTNEHIPLPYRFLKQDLITAGPISCAQAGQIDTNQKLPAQASRSYDQYQPGSRLRIRVPFRTAHTKTRELDRLRETYSACYVTDPNNWMKIAFVDHVLRFDAHEHLR